MTKAIISVDTGKGFTKFARLSDDGNEFIRDEFYTRYTVLDGSSDVLLGKESYSVKYGDKRYVVGLQGAISTEETRNKNLEIHKISTYTAITRLLKKDENEVGLVINVPSSSYASKSVREETIEFYKNNSETINIEVNGENFSFKITDVIPVPEGAGFLFRHPELCEGEITVINIGKLNINAISILNQDIVKMICLEYGGAKLENDTKKLVENELGGRDITEGVNTLFNMLKRGYYEEFGKEVEGTRKVVESSRKAFIDTIASKLKKDGVDIALSRKIHFTGGTSLALNDEIVKHEQLNSVAEIAENAKWVDVEGGLIYGISALGSESEVAASND